MLGVTLPNRRRKPSLVVGLVAALTVVSPLGATLVGHASPEVKPAAQTDLASVLLKTVPDALVPIKQLTGITLPDLRLSDLIPLPLPPGLKLPDIPLSLPLAPGQPPITDPQAVISPSALPSDMADKLGTQVKAIHRDKPFSLVALSAKDMSGNVGHVRAQKADGSWGPWLNAEALGWRSNTPGALTGTDPIYVGKTKDVQIMLNSAAKDATKTAEKKLQPSSAGAIQPSAETTTLDASAAAASTTDGTSPAAAPAAEPTPPSDISATLIDPGSSQDDANLKLTQLPNGGPKVVSRADWGADESIRCQEPTIDDAVTAGTVHHTAGTNDYAPEEAAGIVRSIYRYHTVTLGWCDMGYQALVDKFGRIFEGRYGGMTRNVEGAHAGGFNEGTVGVSMMGDFDTIAPTDAQIASAGQFLGWRLKLAGVDPLGHAVHTSEGTSYTKYAEGERVDLPNIFAHRDVGLTDCPGDAAYAKLDAIRQIAAGVPAPAVQLLPLEAIASALAGVSSPTAAVAPLAAATGVPAAANTATPSATSTGSLQTGSSDTSSIGSLLQATDNNAIAHKWASLGGATGALGPALTSLLQMSGGQSVARFANGLIFTTAGDTNATDPQTVVMTGKLFDTFMQMGNVKSILGLPTGATTAGPAQRIDFQGGSLIFDQITGLVEMLKK